MYNNKRILCVIPARGGSKGIPLKNITEFAGLPLIAHTAKLAKKNEFFDRVVVSTDHKEIAECAEEYGVETPFWRPESLSGDRISDYQVLSHALVTMEEIDGCVYDIVIMLQPTSPLRTQKQINDCIIKLDNLNCDSVTTVSPIDLKNHPLKLFSIRENNLVYYDQEGENIIARQQLHPLYQRNGIAYAMTKSCLVDQEKVIGNNASYILINEPIVNIDTADDLLWGEYLLSKYTKIPLSEKF